jgi:hypothetical protein
MGWYNFIKIGTSSVFSPKVTPDPIAAKRLAEQFQRASSLVKQPKLQARLRVVSSRSITDNRK